MPENKKDSFTFSDKIKNSKPAFNPFSKRASSKIGSNGKPKKTLFERTKRDAPFFVAAAAALLMLPFLYKYSGSMNEEPIVPPGSEDTIFDPERFGYEPSVEDPNGQIAQLTGRDPFSLIKGWGSDDETEEETLPPYEDFSSRDGLDDTYTPPAPDYRQTVPPATRAAFQRQATKINELGDASMTRASGGGAGFGRFGGANLKAAAKEDSSGGPRQGTKPVSLQPLRAADSPSRSYFGQSSAAQARASRDALSKANAAQALRDAMFTPVDPGRIGGIGTGEFGPGGGAGKIEHVLDYKGITPWWWDMMKERSQKAWEWKYFLWRRNLVEPLVRALADLAVSFGCCVVAGTDDCSMGSFLGRKEGYGKEDTCCGLEKDKIAGTIKQETGLDWGKEACDNYKQALETKYGKKCPGGWESGTKSNGQNLNFWEVRVDCLSNGIFGNGSNRNGPAQLRDRFNCEAVDTTRNFELQASGKADGWNKYHLVVAKNYAPFQGGKNLCNAPVINYNAQSGSGIGENEAKRGEREVNEANTASRSAQGHDEAAMNLIKENMNDGCVIYVAEGPVFDWNKFQVQVKSLLQQLYPDKPQAEYDKAFANMRLYFIEGLAMKQKLSKGSANVGGVKVKGMPVERLPMTYVDFETNFILRHGNSSSDTDKFKDKKRKFDETYTGVDGSSRTKLVSNGKETAQRTMCMFSDFQIKAVAIEDPSVLESVLTFNPNVYGADGSQLNVVMDVYDLENVKLFSRQIGLDQRKQADVGRVDITYQPTQEELKLMGDKAQIDVRWTASFGEKTSQDNAGYTPIPPQPDPNVKPVDNNPPDKPEGPESIYGYATTFAFALDQIPQNITDRRQLTKEQIEISASDAKDAEKSAKAIKQATQAAMQQIKTTSNVLADNMSVYTRAQNFSCLAEVGAENFEVQSTQAKAFMDKIASQYNAQNAQLPQIANPRPFPSVANLVDAMHMAETLNNGQVPKAAVCQMGLLLGTVSKDVSINASRYKDKNGSEYNNTFGAFASYIGMESSYFPSGLSDDSGVPGGANPRFVVSYNTNPAYHWGGYNNNRGPKSTFVSEMQSRQKDGRFPLQDLSLLTGANSLRNPPGSQDGINYNRKLYWTVYTPVWENGCDAAYGDASMQVEDALTYLELLCRNGFTSKPKGNGYQADYAGTEASISADPGRAADTNVPTSSAK